MGLLSKLKSLLGAGEETPSRRGDVDVTVEREPTEVTAETEDAGTDAGADASAGTGATAGADLDEAGEESVSDEVPAEGESTEADSSAAEEAEAPADGPAADSVERIKGIGPSYASRLGEAGVETVGDLTDGDAEALAEETGLSEKRLERWIERARARAR